MRNWKPEIFPTHRGTPSPGVILRNAKRTLLQPRGRQSLSSRGVQRPWRHIYINSASVPTKVEEPMANS